MRNRRVPHWVASHFTTFAIGLLLAGGTIAHGLPSQRANDQRYEALDSFAQSLSLIATSHVDVVGERKLLYGAIRGMVGELDPHSAFYTPSQYTRLRQDTEGEFGGIGLTLGEGGAYPIVEAVVPASPASRAGLQIGDEVAGIDGASTARKKSESSSEPEVSAVAWHSRLRGATGTRVKLRVLRGEWVAPRTLTLVRERIAVPSVHSERIGNVAHISIRRFREATSRDVYRALSIELAKPNTSIILDMRGNPGGLLDKGIEVADYFLDKGVIVSVVSRGGRDVEVARAHKERSFSKAPMVVLVDQNTASASEIIAAALQEAGRATIIGVSTYGKGSVQSFLDLKDGSGLKLTTSRYLTPKGATLEGVGIEPDIRSEAFEPMVVTAGGTGGEPVKNTVKSHKLTGVSAIHREQLLEDPQLLKAFQHLTK
ncbi:MAG: S41 family peptidase [Myxococcales bacterium]|nr:S41 family peptidase [Myxococcales bacterium]